MKIRTLLACIAAIGLLGLGWRITRPHAIVTAPETVIRTTAAPTIPVASATPSPRTEAVTINPSLPSAPSPSQNEATLAAIETSASTYDANEVPALARYLDSNSAEIRAAALQGLIQLGSRDAIPYLKAAAKKTQSDQEKEGLLKAADFLALPTWREHRQEIKARLQEAGH